MANNSSKFLGQDPEVVDVSSFNFNVLKNE